MAYYTMSDALQRHRRLPLAEQLVADTARFVNKVPVSQHRPGAGSDLIKRHRGLQPEVDRHFPHLALVMDAIDALFPDRKVMDEELCSEPFRCVIPKAIKILDNIEKTQMSPDVVLALLLKARLHLRRSHEGKSMQQVFACYETLERIGVEHVPTEGEWDVMSELYANCWALTYSFCGYDVRAYSAWSEANNKTVLSQDKLFHEALRRYHLLELKGSPYTVARAVNNRADLELRRLAVRARRALSHEKKRPAARSDTAAVDCMGEDEQKLRDVLEDLEDAIKASPTPDPMVTCAQILYMLAHSEARWYIELSDVPNAKECLDTMRDDLATAVHYLEMALRCGVGKAIFEQYPEDLNMPALLFCEEHGGQPSSAETAVSDAYREAHGQLMSILEDHSIRLRVICFNQSETIAAFG